MLNIKSGFNITIPFVSVFFAMLLFLTFFCNGCSRKENVQGLPQLTSPLSDSAFVLDTIVTITLYDYGSSETLNECFDLCRTYENIFSRTKSTSEISLLNTSTSFPFTLSEDTANLITYALHYSDLTNGSFDVSIAPISSLWDFKSDTPTLPDACAVQNALTHVNYQNITLDGTSIILQDSSMQLDLGAIAKGYIADRVKEYLLSCGIESALINLGGNLLCVGEKPNGSAFSLGIQKPFDDRNETIALVNLKDMSLVSSGIYERCFTLDGKLYHHILNPKTGYPYENELISVSIISKDSVDGDGLSTSCFALGLEKGMELINSIDHAYAIFIDQDYKIYYSEGLLDQFELTEQID